MEDLVSGLDIGAFMINQEALSDHCITNGQEAGRQVLEQFTPGVDDAAGLTRSIHTAVERAMLGTLRRYVAIETAAQTILAIQKYGKAALSVDALNSRIILAEDHFVWFAGKVTELVKSGVIRPIIRQFGGQSFQVVRVGESMFVRRLAANSTRLALAGGAAFVILDTALAAYAMVEALQMYGQDVKSFAAMLTSEETISIPDAMGLIVEHNRNEQARQLTEDAVIIQNIIDEPDQSKKLLGARNLTAEIIAQIKTVPIKPGRKPDQEWYTTLGDWVSRPTEWMCEVMLDDPDKYFVHQQLSRLSIYVAKTPNIVSALQKLPQNEEVRLTISALQKASEIAQAVIRDIELPVNSQLSAATGQLRQARNEAANKKRREAASVSAQQELPPTIIHEIKTRIRNGQKKGQITSYSFEYNSQRQEATVKTEGNELPWVIKL